ncbi:MAG: hypothetical protein ACNA7J_00345 [Wenzhouxiangella sp.]
MRGSTLIRQSGGFGAFSFCLAFSFSACSLLSGDSLGLRGCCLGISGLSTRGFRALCCNALLFGFLFGRTTLCCGAFRGGLLFCHATSLSLFGCLSLSSGLLGSSLAFCLSSFGSGLPFGFALLGGFALGTISFETIRHRQ